MKRRSNVSYSEGLHSTSNPEAKFGSGLDMGTEKESSLLTWMVDNIHPGQVEGFEHNVLSLAHILLFQVIPLESVFPLIRWTSSVSAVLTMASLLGWKYCLWKHHDRLSSADGLLVLNIFVTEKSSWICVKLITINL